STKQAWDARWRISSRSRRKPMAYSVIMLPAAEGDYREILRYLDRRFESPQAIRTLNQRLREALENLRETPRMYAFSTDEVLRQRGYHKFLIGNYVALFQIDETNQVVEIYRIFHGSQNYAKYL